MVTQLKEVSSSWGSGCSDRHFFFLVSKIFLYFLKGKFYLEDPSGTVQLDMSKAISFHRFVGACQQRIQILYNICCFEDVYSP